MKYAKFDVQYLRNGTWHLNKRFDNIEDAEKRYEDGAANWMTYRGIWRTDAVRVRRVTVQETYETIRQAEPPIRPEVHLTEPGDYLVHIGDSEASVEPWNELLKASRELHAAEEHLAKLHRRQWAGPRPGSVTATRDYPFLDAAVGYQRVLVDDLNLRVLYYARKLGRDIPEPEKAPREPRVNDRVQGKTSLRKGTVVEGHRVGTGLIAVQFDGHQRVTYGLDPKNFRVIESELTERPAPEVIQFPGPPASTVSSTDSDGSVVKFPGRTEVLGKFEVQVRRAGKWESWPSPGMWYGYEYTAMRQYENLTSHGRVEGTGVRLLENGSVIRETTKDPEPPAERFKVEIFHDGEWHPDQPGGFVTHAAAASHYEHTVRRWHGRGGIKGVRLLKDGVTIRGTSTDLKN